MTDADTLLLAYFRQEYQIQPYQARALLALYSARRALSTAEWSIAAGVPIPSLKPGIFGLRRALGHEWIGPDATTCMAGKDRQIKYRLTAEGRAGIEHALKAALNGLAKRCNLG